MMERRSGAAAAAVVAAALVAVASCAGGGSSENAGLTKADLRTLRDDLEARTFETVVRILYETEGARADFLAQAAADPQDTARLAEINADGQVTFEEFRSLSDVQDAVHHYGGGDIITFFEQRVIEAQRPE
ncbi:hypothetical protein [Pseudonocardia lacus]|uniref:hypothetical protein n=1 Tax=Pseudonocardia lacus TaxID=2835865 RepID=UPI001BDD8F69|nr:hypothetical protein [Pseudonocardia lacus]